MSPIIVDPQWNAQVCSVSRAGIGMVQAVVDQAGWKIGERIEIGFIEKARCILLRGIKGDGGFKLSYSNARKKTGGRIVCRARTSRDLTWVLFDAREHGHAFFLLADRVFMSASPGPARHRGGPGAAHDQTGRGECLRRSPGEDHAV
jgi:hypothetical protein